VIFRTAKTHHELINDLRRPLTALSDNWIQTIMEEILLKTMSLTHAKSKSCAALFVSKYFRLLPIHHGFLASLVAYYLKSRDEARQVVLVRT
jgi:hypothetical protein